MFRFEILSARRVRNSFWVEAVAFIAYADEYAVSRLVAATDVHLLFHVFAVAMDYSIRYGFVQCGPYVSLFTRNAVRFA